MGGSGIQCYIQYGKQGSPQEKFRHSGWVEFVTTSTIWILKAWGAAMLKGSGQRTLVSLVSKH